jgi:hypothetical protein
MLTRGAKWHAAIQAGVLAGLGILAAVQLWNPFVDLDNYDEQITSETAERNERSTPRSFVLPATPAVALEQERQLAEKTTFHLVAKCMSHLRELGFSIPDNETVLNAQLVAAIFQFQNQEGLTATGKLDEPTKEALKCQN